MSSTVTTSSQWVQYYDQTVDELATSSFGGSDATAVATTAGGSLTPKGNLSKPIRRRSRASKKTPTTILNTSASNFRALVQQFTGCPTSRSGPINLNFATRNRQSDRQVGTVSNIPRNNNSTGNYYYNYQSVDRREGLPNHQEQYRAPNDVVVAAATATTRATYTENIIPGDFAMEDISNLEEIMPGEIPAYAASGDLNQSFFS